MPHSLSALTLAISFANHIGFAEPADYVPTIASPYAVRISQPDLIIDTSSRYGRHYPGMDYVVKVGVLGGDFRELVYTLTDAPANATIDASTGVLTWTGSGDVTLDSTHSFSVSVTDGTTTDTRTWSTLVTTTGFVFVDPNVADGGVGTIGDPFNKWADFYGTSSSDDAFADDFVICRTGTLVVGEGVSGITDGHGMHWNTNKTNVIMPYAGETVTQDWANVYMFFGENTDNFHYEGFINLNVGAGAPDNVAPSQGEYVKGIRILSGSNNVSINGNMWFGIPDIAGSDNQSYVMLAHGGVGRGFMMYNNYFDCARAECYAFVQYSHEDGILESNVIVNCGNIGLGLKNSYRNWAIRGNKISGLGTKGGIWIYNAEAYWDAGNDPLNLRTADVEIAFNSCDMEVYSTNTNEKNITNIARPYYSHHNTFRSPQFYEALQSTQIAQFEDHYNVTVSNDADGIVYENPGNNNAGKLTISNQLLSTTSDDFVDFETGLLIGAFVGQNSTHGCAGLAGNK